MTSRRNFITGAGAITGAVAAASVSKVAMAALPEPVLQTSANTMPPLAPSSGRPYNPVVTLNGWTLPWRMNNGVKEFHLVAEPVVREMAPGFKANLWGYNGQSPGPTIEVVEGDRVRIFVTNKLPEHTSIHWHGQRLPNGMDGVAGLNQPPIRPGKTFVYEFVARRPGTFMYHPHADEMTQMAMGMMGFWVTHEFLVTGTDGGPTFKSSRQYEVTTDVAVGQMRQIEFLADEEGDWAFHCHKSHHTMNAMGHDVPTMIGLDHKDVAQQISSLVPDYMVMGERGMADMAEMEMPIPDNTARMMTGEGPFGSVEMGGMFSVVKVRKNQKPGDYSNPGWFKHPRGTVAYELNGPAPETSRQRGAGAAAMPAQNMPAKNIEVQIRKPGSGHTGH
ncbi:TPA: copper oxidase [Pseudomonas aeruginosa]|nr:copper oxidase [Pseudomonas aeruginosa]